jgi:hypothetical protein
MNPYVFIVGCPRSGTTLLQRVLDAHPNVAVMPEAHWIYELVEKRTGMTPEKVVESDIVPALMGHAKFARLGITCDQLLGLIGENQGATYSTLVRRIFDVYGRMRNKELVGNKTPALVRRLEVLHELWPEVRIVHLVRDGRDVFLSMKNRPLHNQGPGARMGWTEDPVSTVALWWELNVQMGRKAGKTLGPRLYHEVLYETFVKHPTEACADLCAFLAAPYTDAMLRFYEDGKTRKASLPITPGLRNWRSQMSPHDVEVFESAAGRMLDDLGYSRACPHPARELVTRSSLKRDLLLARSRRYARAYEGATALAH